MHGGDGLGEIVFDDSGVIPWCIILLATTVHRIFEKLLVHLS